MTAFRDIPDYLMSPYLGDQPLKLDERELATVLAALRYWQKNLKQTTWQDKCFLDIASDNGRLEPLDIVDIDILCELLNEGKHV